MTRNKSLFLFNDQVKENMFLSLVPAMVVATAWESLGWWAYANGVAPHWSFDDNPVWFVVLLGFVPIWSVLYFGAGHWMLHRAPVYAHVHSWHHRNMNIGPWSGLSMHPLEHVVLYSDREWPRRSPAEGSGVEEALDGQARSLRSALRQPRAAASQAATSGWRRCQ